MRKIPKQTSFQKIGGWGGKRKGAGRKNRSGKLNHLSRSRVNFKKPLHITHRLVAGCPTLRRRYFLKLFRASAGRAKKLGFHVVHYSILRNHLHIIAEARDNRALSRGMASLAGSLARALNLRHDRVGPVFDDRYHLRVITNPPQMKRTLEYVLLNFAKHVKTIDHLDTYSSAAFFPDWIRLIGSRVKWDAEYALRTDLASAGLTPPQSWLASVGWMRARR